MMTGAPIDIRDQDGVTVATLSGEIDAANASDLGAHLLDGVASASAGLVVDLAGVRYIDSAGIRTLFWLAHQLETRRQRLALAVPETSPVQRLIKITNLAEVAGVCADLGDCVSGLLAPE